MTLNEAHVTPMLPASHGLVLEARELNLRASALGQIGSKPSAASWDDEGREVGLSRVEIICFIHFSIISYFFYMRRLVILPIQTISNMCGICKGII